MSCGEEKEKTSHSGTGPQATHGDGHGYQIAGQEKV